MKKKVLATVGVLMLAGAAIGIYLYKKSSEVIPEFEEDDMEDDFFSDDDIEDED